MNAAACVWLYAVVPDVQPPVADVSDISGVAGEPLYLVAGPGVAAAAGAVPREDFDEEPLRAHLQDVAWLDRTVRTHHQAVAALARSGPVLPMRYATVYREDSGAAAMLQAQGGELSAALDRIAGRTEWGVKVFLAHRSGAKPAPSQSADERNPGTAYLLRRKAQRDDGLQARQRAADDADQIHRTLAGAAAECTRHPLQTAEASGRREPMVLNGAYLVDDERLPAFTDAIASFAAAHSELTVERTGPWPPYSFTGIGGLVEGK